MRKVMYVCTGANIMNAIIMLIRGDYVFALFVGALAGFCYWRGTEHDKLDGLAS